MTLVLGIETATMMQAIALYKDGQLLGHWQRFERQNHGVTLLEHIDQALKAQELSLSDVGLVSVGVGPGSFTGLRVGLATAKGLSRVAEAPIVGVSTLAALALGAASTSSGPVWAALDARRREVYAGLYRVDAGSGELEVLAQERAYSPVALTEALQASVEAHGAGLAFVGHKTDVYKPLAASALRELGVVPVPAPLEHPSAAAVALLGLRRFEAQGHGDDLASLEPNYIRPSDAELNFKPK